MRRTRALRYSSGSNAVTPSASPANHQWPCKQQSQQQQKCISPSISSSSSCVEAECCCEKFCPEMTVHIPQFIILPVNDEVIFSSTEGTVIGPIDHVPIVGVDYPYDNAVFADTPAFGQTTWTHYTITEPIPGQWFATLTTTIFTTNIWGHGPDNFDYYIGNNLVVNGNDQDITPINYINFLPSANPSPADISQADDNTMTYLSPRGYLVSNFWGSDIFYFQFRAALRRFRDESCNNSSPPYRYYVEFQRLDAPFNNGIWPTLQPQLLTHIKLPEVGPDGEVPPYFACGDIPANPLQIAFKNQPDTIKNKVALWGKQGPQPYSRLSHSAEVDAIIPELSRVRVAEANYGIDPNPTTLAALNAANVALKAAYPKIRVWPSPERPISLNAWIGVKPPCLNVQYYIAKFFVGTSSTDPSLLELTSTATTQPIGAPIAYPHYNNPDAYYDWTVPSSYPDQMGVPPVIQKIEPNPTVIEGYGGPVPGTPTNPVLPGTIGRLRFIPIISNNNYVGNVPVSLKNTDIPVPDSGFVMFFQLHREQGLTRNTEPTFKHILHVRRLTPFPQEYPRNMIFDAEYMTEPSLLLPNRYNLLPKIDMDIISGDENPQWSNPQYRFVNYVGQWELPQSTIGNTGVLSDGTVIPSGVFQYHDRQRLPGESDDNTVIMKLTWNVYPNECNQKPEISFCNECEQLKQLNIC